MQKLRAIFISHEHSDHIKGISTLAAKYNLPVYITTATLASCNIGIAPNLVKPFKAYLPINIGKLSITAFPKFHDACEPHSFIIASNGIKVGVFTDIGTPCTHVQKHFKQCNAAFLEANYDDDMLMNGNYPFHLKKRISGTLGHLSNRQALEIFMEHRPKFMSHLILSHLSKENNTPQIVSRLFKQYAGTVEIIVASRNEETNVYRIAGAGKKSIKSAMSAQLSLSFA